MKKSLAERVVDKMRIPGGGDRSIQKHLRRLALNFANAKVDLAFLGSSDPQDFSEIRADYRKARKALYDEIEDIVRNLR